MKTAVKNAAVACLALKERLSRLPMRYLLVLGHMRSGSSLLHHVLVSHPDLLGCGERNAEYRSPADLHRLTLAARYHRRAFLQPCRYMVDQINHNQFIPQAGFLNNPQLWTIFLVREPAGAISSMVRMLGQYHGTTVDDALNHYVDRLRRLAQYAQTVKNSGQAALVVYDDLVDHTEETLARLQVFLDLEAPLSPHYRLFEFTGKRGDPGPNIRQGKVQRPVASTAIDIPAGQLAQAEAVYEETMQALKPFRLITGVR
jgi:hypothetical protein